ncbi:tetratricopeptide repeat protein [Clostridium acetireducens DSM 10703]|uniref:Tetratricopeptide repeat protein n=1 Tax=Clostridium acetireducens DSM 10703 TaxID=1121290 RepID=A0A1E8EZ88_9CLOT|nr:FxLYD domain-containing protein [Clostridium acetireducens]OFI06480.1 tetratricopeptide repeat protein [Clostridium acetireducens DSM 10703]
MFCENCGSKVLEEDKFCPNCGAKLEKYEEKNKNISDKQENNFKNKFWFKPVVATVFSVVLVLGTYGYEVYVDNAVENMRIKAENQALKGNINEAYNLVNKALSKRPNNTALKQDIKFLTQGKKVDNYIGKLPNLIKNHKYDEALGELDKASEKISEGSGKFYDFLDNVIKDKKAGITVLQIKEDMNNKNSIEELVALLMKISSYDVKEAKDTEKILKSRISSLAYNKANEYLKNNNFNEAINIIDKALQYNSSDKKLISFKENINKQKEKFEKSESERIEKAMEAAAIQDKNNKTNAVKVLSTNCNVNEYGDFVVSGQVKNIASKAIGFIAVYFTIYDSKNNVLGRDSTYVYPDALYPNEQGEFSSVQYGIYSGHHIGIDKITWYLN